MNGENKDNSYRSIFRNTTIFGGAKTLQILINIIRVKFIAVILGSVGMGINSLYYSACIPIQQLAIFGMNIPFVKDISSRTDDIGKDRLILLCRRIFLYAAFIGTAVCMIFSPLLSYYAFGDYNNVWWFMAMGFMVFFGVLGCSEMTLLQANHQIKKLSISSVVGSVVGLCICVPLYYLFGDKAIVPALIIISFSTYLFYYFAGKSSRNSVKINIREYWPAIKKIVLSGGIFVIDTVIFSIFTFLINIFIRTFGSVSDVGLYQAANSITNQYSMLVLAALAADFLPRISKVSSDNRALNSIVNRQLSVIMLLIIPIAIIVIAFSPIIVRLLLSEDFASIIPLIRWFAIGVMLKISCYPLAYITLVKDNKKVFFLTEVVTANLLYIILSCILYYFIGFEGLGIAMIAMYGIMLPVYIAVNYRLYAILPGRFNLLILLLGIIAAIFAFFLTYIDTLFSLIVLILVSLATLIICLRRLKLLIRSTS